MNMGLKIFGRVLYIPSNENNWHDNKRLSLKFY
jgi:hypothetical protein